MPDYGNRLPFRLRRLAALVVLLVIGLGVWGAAAAQEPEEESAVEPVLSLEALTLTSMTVIWDDVTGATSYAVRWRLVGTPGFEPAVTVTTERHQISGLLPGRQYVVRVEASDADGTVLARLKGLFYTHLSTPVGFAVTGASAGSLSVSWGKPKGWDPSAYELRWRRPSDDQFLGSVRLAGSATSHTLTGLDDQTEYILNMVALNDADVQSFDVKDRGWAVDPLALTLSAASEDCPARTRTDLSWEISGGLKPYRLWVQSKKTDLETTESLRVNCGPLPSGPPADDPMAKPTKTFSARVLDGLGTEATAEATVNLVTLSPPTLNAPREASSSVELTWTAPADWTPVAYRLRWRLPGSIEFLGTVDLGADARSYALSGLEADNQYVLRLTAVHRDGPESRADTARVSTYPELTLILSSSREVCTATTLTELSWEIAGGKPPYTLTIEGEAVDADAESYRVNCGSIGNDQSVSESVPLPRKRFGALLKDKGGVSVAAYTEVQLATPLPAPIPRLPSGGETIITSAWVSEDVHWVREDPARPGVRMAWWLSRWRAVGATEWSYLLTEERGPSPISFVYFDGLAGGLTYEFAHTALRDPIEQLTPDAHSWSAVQQRTTTTAPTGVRATATHSTITVTWDDQPSVESVYVRAVRVGASAGGSVRVERDADSSNRATIIDLEPRTEYVVEISVDGDDTYLLTTTIMVTTDPAPPGYQSPARGAQGLTAAPTHNTIALTWEAPTPNTRDDWVITIRHASVEHARTYWVREPLRLTIDMLQPETTYTIEVLHMDRYRTKISRTVTTTPAPQSAAITPFVGGPPGPLPVPRVAPTFSWPYAFSEALRMTADPWSWRAGSGKFHVGLDLAVRAGSEGDRRILAAAPGILRVYLLNPGQFVVYCPTSSAHFEKQFHVSSSTTSAVDSIGVTHKPCGWVVSKEQGRTALIFHGSAGGRNHLTKYSHLASLSPEINAKLKDTTTGSSYTQVARGDFIGMEGATGGNYGPHLHFEMRWFDGQAYISPSDWYGADAIANCANGTGNTAAVGPASHCGWTASRTMKTTLDPERHLPPAPASRTATSAVDLPTGHGRVFALASTSRADATQPTSLQVEVDVATWRPHLYTYVPDDYEDDSKDDIDWPNWRDESRKYRIETRGIAGTRPGVDVYHLATPCAQPVDRGPDAVKDLTLGELPLQRVAVVLANAGSSCTVEVRTGNPTYVFGVATGGIAHYGKTPLGSNVRPEAPRLHLERMRTLEPGTIERSDVFEEYEFHFYPFYAVLGEVHQFATSLPEDNAVADVVMEVWGPDGMALHPDGTEVTNRDHLVSHNVPLYWTANSSGMHFLLVRAGHAASVAPPEGGYIVTSSLRASGCTPVFGGEEGAGGSGDSVSGAVSVSCQMRPPTGLETRATASSIALTWTVASGVTYEVKGPSNVITDVGTRGSYTIEMLQQDRWYTVFVRSKDSENNVSLWVAARDYTTDPTVLPTTLVIDASTIAGDGTVNIQEKADGFSISGTATEGASVRVTVGGTTLSAALADEDGDWSVTVPADSAYITEGSVSISADASKEDHENATATATIQVDLTAPVVSYLTPNSLKVETVVTVTPTSTHTDIDSFALASGEELPSGLSLNAATGVVSGTPDERGEDATETDITVRDEAGNSGTATLSLPKIDGLEQVLSGFAYSPATTKWGDDAPTLTAPTGAVGALTYSASPASVCTVNEDTGALSAKGLGKCTVSATAAATKTHDPATVEATVTITEPTLTGVVRAVNRSNGQVEFSFRTAGGEVHLPSPYRFVWPHEMTPGTWTSSSSFTVEVDGLDFTVGRISVRLYCAGYIEVTLRPAEGVRQSPDMRNFYYKREPVDEWYASDTLTVTLTLSAKAEGAVGTAAAQMEAAEPGVAYPSGIEGGLLGQAGAVGAAAVSTDPCTPENLEVSNIGQGTMTLSWDAAPGAAGYEVKRTQATTPVASSGTTSHKFDELSASTEYTLSVRAKRGTQTSGWAELTRTTSACSNVPSSARTLPLSEERWSGTGAIQDEQRRTGTQSQTRTVNWSDATCTGTVGDWRDSGQPSWTEWTNTSNKRCNPKVPTKPRTEKTETVTVTLDEWQVRGDTAYERERTDTEHYSRTVTRQMVADGCGWNVGDWGDPDRVDRGAPRDSGTSKKRDDPKKRQVTLSTTFSWVVRGDTAHKQVTLRLRDDERPYVWSGAPDNKWELGDWQEGTPYTKGPEDVDPPETNKKPPTEIWTTEVDTAKTGRTRVIRVQTEPICLEQDQEEYRFRIKTSSQPYVWNGVDDWVLGEETSITPPVWHSGWEYVGSQRLCALSRGEGEAVDGSSAPATFAAGVHTLQWGVNWLQFTVPEDTTVSLVAKADAEGELVAVFAAESGAELQVSMSSLASGEHPTSTDLTLAALATSLALVAQPADVPVGVTAAPCAVATLSGSPASAQVDLDANGCVQVVGYGVARLVASERTLTVILPDGHEWIVFSVPATNESAPSGIWLIDLDSGSMLVLDPVTATETARLLDSPGSAVGAVFDAITASASASEE
ncbi:MAG: fibronectin type III domain-containing protein [Chloroflexi bacterium]|nr:fibronectin type III domain-containing protein [Chloroflexota bacterium]